MKRGYVLDTSVLMKYLSYNKLYRLFNIVSTYNITVYANTELINEIERNLPRIVKSSPLSYQQIMDDLLLLVTPIITTPSFTQSPAPKDNFLFDLALQTGSEVIVSDEKKLLFFENTPVPVRSLGWFKETFPVEL